MFYSLRSSVVKFRWYISHNALNNVTWPGQHEWCLHQTQKRHAFVFTHNMVAEDRCWDCKGQEITNDEQEDFFLLLFSVKQSFLF